MEKSKRKTFKNNTLIIRSVIVLGIAAGLAFGYIGYLKYKEYKISLIRMEMERNILDGATAKPIVVNVDYARQIATGSPLVFGGAHSPLPEHKGAWDLIKQSGVTMIRRDFFIEQILPTTISLSDYKNNVNNIQDPRTWNQDAIKWESDRFKMARSKGIATMGILDYAPAWLTNSGTPYSMPSDWAVYEDIVKKIYTIYRPDVDYLEIWNEPTYDRFLKPVGSDTVEGSYVAILRHAIHAIREVDAAKNDGRHARIGGLVADNPNRLSMLEAMVKEKDIMKELSYISYHNYGYEEPSSTKYREMLAKAGYAKMPLMLTEWNYSSEEFKPNDFFSTDKAIPFTAEKLMSFMQQGLIGANYFILEPADFNIPGVGKRYMGFYAMNQSTATPLPQAKTWKLMSRTLGLGDGTSMVVDTSSDEPLQAMGAVNVHGVKTLVLSNASDTPQLVELQLNNLDLKKRAVVMIYSTAKDFDGSTPVRREIAEVSGNAMRTRFYMPEQSVAGVQVAPFTDQWFDFFDAVTHQTKP